MKKSTDLLLLLLTMSLFLNINTNHADSVPKKILLLSEVISEVANAIRPVFWGSIALGLAVLAYSWFFTGLRQVEDDIDCDKSPDEAPLLDVEGVASLESTPYSSE